MLVETKNILELAKKVFDIEAQCILKLKERLDDRFEKAVEILYNTKGKVIVTGMGKSGLIGRKIASTLTSTGTPSCFLHPAESTHGDSGIISRNDTVIAISNSGETSELLNLLPLIKRFNVSLVAICGKPFSTLGKTADVVLDISVEREACPLNKAPTASTTATVAMGDALAVCLLEKRNFTVEDFLLFHPSGSLGKGILYKIEDLMIKGQALPQISPKQSFLEAVKYISDMKLGCTVVVENNKIVGILTDGDIRRTLLNKENIQNLKVEDVMTKNPKVVKPQDLAAKALALMEKYSITSLVCSNDNFEPLGLIHIHDLLKAGVA